jgi:NAD(P) transhydrogenase subunit alpha
MTETLNLTAIRPLKVGVAAEVVADEPRAAATPETVKKIIGLGADVAVEPGAGDKSGILDADYVAAGAKMAIGAPSAADIVLKVRRPSSNELAD